LKLLAVDTSSDWCSAALWVDARVIGRDGLAGQRHSELILPMVDALLREAGLALRALDAVAFGAGPGSFTGLRIACGVAQGLALGAGVPVVPVCTLEALAEASGAGRAIAALDARMGEIYHAAYERRGDGWCEVHAPSLCAPDQAPAVVGGGWVGCGNAFAVHAQALRTRYADAIAAEQPDLVVHARAIAGIAARAAAAGRTLDPAQAAPLYVRDKVALSVAERAARGPRDRVPR
jgi:tRNA threonylcarbamoyladenosine biosynthesis protein TsaB